jgi:DNA polymerase-3 subunit epsilon
MEAFIAIDYETANSHHESACALGVSIVENGEVIDSAESLIKPPKEFSDFDPFNTMIHGIQKKDVKSAPDFKKVWQRVQKFH